MSNAVKISKGDTIRGTYLDVPFVGVVSSVDSDASGRALDAHTARVSITLVERIHGATRCGWTIDRPAGEGLVMLGELRAGLFARCPEGMFGPCTLRRAS